MTENEIAKIIVDAAFQIHKIEELGYAINEQMGKGDTCSPCKEPVNAWENGAYQNSNNDNKESLTPHSRTPKI